MDPHSFYLLEPDPHSEKLLDRDLDPQKMNADPQPWITDPNIFTSLWDLVFLVYEYVIALIFG